MWQSVLICAYFASMQAVIFGTSGMKSRQRRIASGVQACRVPSRTCSCALALPARRARTVNNATTDNTLQNRKLAPRMTFPPAKRCKPTSSRDRPQRRWRRRALCKSHRARAVAPPTDIGPGRITTRNPPIYPCRACATSRGDGEVRASSSRRSPRPSSRSWRGLFRSRHQRP
jgi:hypothetical protein